ncbi:MAG: urea ABC transporter ATP-binding protein UrtD [Burkholderiales bacterium]|nr:MAG: urea ABC transporter ATP-binding protein UrtD [Burkholderiales bacterium]TAG84350.1 MAG: urea ABC transporter ATP-binding protein UrtD [Betaproteobacteria bacterium]
MTPDLLDAGAKRLAEYREKHGAEATAQSGGQAASFARVVQPNVVDTASGGILYVDEVTVSFDGFRALNKLSLDIRVGELRCIIGPNGAGKTTMMDVITGKTKPDSGKAFFGSNIDLLRLRESEIAERGIGRKFQKPTVFEHLSVFENLELAAKTDRRVRRTMFAKLTASELDQLHSTMKLIQLAQQSARVAGNLSHGQKQWLEIGMLLMQKPQLLLLDEPVAGMTDEETERTAELFLSLEGKHSLVVVEHDMKFIGELVNGGQRVKKKIVTVLHEGSVLAEGSLADVQSNDRVIEVYLGR